MQKIFSTQPELFISASDLNHPILHSLDNTRLYWIGLKLKMFFLLFITLQLVAPVIPYEHSIGAYYSVFGILYWMSS
jgi:hypothetical protein